MRRPATALALTLLCFAAAPAHPRAWSLDVHRFVMGEAIKLLPDPIRPFFEKHRAYIVEHTVDPDLWRNAGFADEPPRHFVDMDSYGAFPFASLPADLDRAIEKFGPDFVARNGELPWRTTEMFGRLRRAFESVPRGGYALEDVKSDSAWLAHYIGDSHVPLHAVINYDGDETGQKGVHSRFEGELFARFRSRLTIAPRPPAPVSDVRAFVFQNLRDSFQLAEPVLKADRDAAEGRTQYDDEYFEKFFAGAKPILERRVNDSITAIASVIVAAWEQGGKPPLPLEATRTVAPIRKKPGQ